MNIDSIRKSLSKYVGKDMSFSYYGSRGQIDKFKGKITNLYPRIFSVMTESGVLKTFSYSDFAINHLKIH